ncbi:MAG TPA: DUF2802 domain-containing protein [Rhodocyclaceae bacterium]|nr:DUF2802 domain-containing protein [Rhodocyclaceae bacterium]
MYLAYMWLRLTQVRRRKRKSETPLRLKEPKAKQASSAKLDIVADSVDDIEDDESDAVYIKPRNRVAENPAPEAATGRESSGGFDRMLNESQQRIVQSQARELQLLQEEVRVLQQTQADMRDEIEQLKAARNVSPLYNEALNMAQHGLNAEGIASRCGISIAEAELVAALANKSEPASAADPDEEYHGQAASRYAA